MTSFEADRPDGPPSSIDFNDYEIGLDTADELAEAEAAGNWGEADRLENVQRHQAGVGMLQTMMRGGDIRYDTSAISANISNRVRGEQMLMGMLMKEHEVDDAIGEKNKLVSDWWHKGIMPAYQEKNAARLVKDPKNDAEFMAQIQQNEPIVVAPEVRNQMIATMMEIDKAGKAVDPTFSVFTDERTRSWATWLNREADVGGLGYIVAGKEKPVMGGVLGTAQMMAIGAVESVVDPGLAIAFGLWNLGDRAVRALGGPGIAPPHNYVEGPNGEPIIDENRAPGFMDIMSALWGTASADGAGKAEAILWGRKAMELEQENRGLLANIAVGLSRVAGMGVGFGLPAGWAMGKGAQTFTALNQKGMAVLATGMAKAGLKEGVKGVTSPRILKISQLMAAGFGASVGHGIMNATAYGKADGYAHAFLNGFAMTPVLMALGWAGKATEKKLAPLFARNKMPRRMASVIGGAVEGVGFGTLEMAQIGPLWEFMKNPSKETFEIYASNILGFALLKGLHPPSTPGMAAFGAVEKSVEVARFRAARAAFAERVFRGEDVTKELAEKPEISPTTLRELGEVVTAQRAAQENQAEFQRLSEKRDQLERELDVQEMGVRPKEEQPPRPPVREEEVTRLKEEPTSFERTAEATEAVRRSDEAREEAVRDLMGAGSEAEVKAARSEYEKQAAVRKELGVREAPKMEEMTREALEKRAVARQEVARSQAKFATKRLEKLARQEKRLESKPESAEKLARIREEQARLREELSTPPSAEERFPAESEELAMLYGPSPTRQLEATPGTRETAIDDIFAEMAGRPGRAGIPVPFFEKRIGAVEPDPVRVAIREGKVPKGAFGLFKHFENLIRLQSERNVVIGAHEWSHAMQRHSLAVRGGQAFDTAVRLWSRSLPPEARAEFDVLLRDYAGAEKLSEADRAGEAWAMWHGRNLLGDETLRPSTPELSKVMEEFLSAQENRAILSQYQRIQSAIRRYNEQGAIARSMMSFTEPGQEKSEARKATEMSVAERFTTSAIERFYDDIVQLRRGQEKWLKAVGRNPSEFITADDPAALLDAFRMTAGKTVGRWVVKDTDSPAGKIASYESIMKRVKGNDRLFKTYFMAVVNAQMAKRGMATQQPLRDLSYTIERLQTAYPEFRTAARELKQWSDQGIDYAADMGAISREKAEKIKAAYVLYVPTLRAMEQVEARGGGAGVEDAGIGHRKGSTLTIEDPFGNLLRVMESLVSRANQHKVYSAMYKMSQMGEAGGLATVISRDKVPHKHPTRQIIDALESKAESLLKPGEALDDTTASLFKALRENDALDASTITLFSQSSHPPGDKPIIAFTPRLTAEEISRVALDPAHAAKLRSQQGKEIWMQVDTEAYNALQRIDKAPTLGWFDKPVLREILRYPAAITRFFATGVNVAFTIANIPRDILSYAVFDQKGKFSPLSGMAQWVRGGSLYMAKGGIRDIYESSGARSASFYSEGQRRAMLGQHRTILQQTRHKIASVLDQVKSVLEAPENFIRIAEFRDAYEAAKGRKLSEFEARMEGLRAGREITINFARAGLLSRALNQVIPYFNAALQGQRKVVRQLAFGGDAKTDAQRVKIQRAAFANGLATMTAPSMLLWALNHDEEWYQELPEWRKSMYWNMKLGDVIISISKPWELGVLLGSIPEAIADALTAEGKPVRPQTLFRDMFLSYLDGPAALLPAVLRPLIEGESNYSFFRRRALTPEWVERTRLPEEQATAYTTELSKILSGAIGGMFTPIEIEHYLGGYTAGATTTALRAMDELFGLKDHPGMSINPFARFVRQEPFGQARSVDRLYQLSIRLGQLEGSERITGGQRALKTRIEEAKRQISKIRRAAEQGRISTATANERVYNIAKPLVKRGDTLVQ